MPKLKKEFVTYWSNKEIKINSFDLSLMERYFFEDHEWKDFKCMIMPDGIKYNDLLSFIGKKTKITIEVVE